MHLQKRKELGEKLKVLTLRSVAGIATLSFEDWALQFPVYQYVFNYIIYIYNRDNLLLYSALYTHTFMVAYSRVPADQFWALPFDPTECTEENLCSVGSMRCL